MKEASFARTNLKMKYFGIKELNNVTISEERKRIPKHETIQISNVLDSNEINYDSFELFLISF